MVALSRCHSFFHINNASFTQHLFSLLQTGRIFAILLEIRRLETEFSSCVIVSLLLLLITLDVFLSNSRVTLLLNESGQQNSCDCINAKVFMETKCTVKKCIYFLSRAH